MCKITRSLFCVSSILIVVAGLAIIVATLTMMTTLTFPEKVESGSQMGDSSSDDTVSQVEIELDLERSSKQIAIGAGVLAVLTLCIGCCGINTFRNVTKCKICSFACLALIIGSFLAVAGIFLCTFYFLTEDRIDKFCDMAYYEPTPINRSTSRKQLRQLNWR